MSDDTKLHRAFMSAFISANFATWSSWGTWTTCSDTCGTGSQTRTRTCTREGTEADCSGDASDSRDCNTHQCPGVQTMYFLVTSFADYAAILEECIMSVSLADCATACTEGTLVTGTCTHCECSNTYTGSVISDDGTPVRYDTAGDSHRLSRSDSQQRLPEHEIIKALR